MTPALPKRNEPFRAGETALLLVDVQRVWLEPGADPAHPELLLGNRWADKHQR
ncbi:hypothetical protein NMG46_10025 [Mesorhizobium sp. LMG 17147]|uniref:hypothetical protein n=1 Tax=Mesorhizobium sp. LMG 17147 TaxID=2963091 RepID=UPI0020C97293|nr:hypothetical protein [Mesorhizobium sp. LMG 17147]MCP9230581.1 hypothetical protein [Mesorhizobium sp. LMG 17147]